MWKALRDSQASGSGPDDADWRRHHRLLLWVLAAQFPAIVALGLAVGEPLGATLVWLAVPAMLLGIGFAARRRRAAAVAVAAGLTCCSALLAGLIGADAALVHVLVVVGLVALYRSWAPTLAVVVVTLLGYVLGPAIAVRWPGAPPFADPATLSDPWPSTFLHGGAVLLLGVVITATVRLAGAEAGAERNLLARRLTEVELTRRYFVAELLVNLARRAQGPTNRQLEILGALRQAERDPDRLAELGTLDQLATQVRRNAENLLVLAGEQPSRPALGPLRLREVVKAAVAETEHPDRVLFVVDEHVVACNVVGDLTQLLAELVENALRFSPPDTVVSIWSGPDPHARGRQLTVEDRGVGMPPSVIADANAILAEPREVDLSIAQRLGLQVIARLAQRHGIIVTLTAGTTAGVVCTVGLPAALFETVAEPAPKAKPTSDELDEPPEAATTAIPAAAVAGDPDPATTAIPLPSPPAETEPPTVTVASLPRPVPAPDDPADVAAEPVVDSPPPLPVRTPAQGSALAATAPFAAVPGARRPAECDPWQPASFGTSDNWAGWWDSPGERPSPVSATAPTSTGPWPVGQGAGEHPVPAPRPQPTAAAPPEPLRPEPMAGWPAAPIAWVDPQPAADPAPDAADTPTDTGAGLRKRVPQANLAPRLRMPLPEPGPSPTRPSGHTVEAAAALSRYQASRQMAGTTMHGTAAAEQNRPGGVDTPPAAADAAGTAPRGYDSGHPSESVTGHDAYRIPPVRAADGSTPDAAGADRSTPQDAEDPAKTPRPAADPEGGPTAGPVPGENSDMHPAPPDNPATGRTDGPR